MSRLPIAIVAACLSGLAIALALPPTAYSERDLTLLFTAFAVPYVLVGGLLAVRRPEHVVGRLTLGVGALMTLEVVSGAYAGYALLRDTSLPLGLEAAWMGTMIFI